MLKVWIKGALLTPVMLLTALVAFSTTVILDDGTILKGSIVNANTERVILQTSVGLVEVPQSSIVQIIDDTGPGDALQSTGGTVSGNIIIQPDDDGVEEQLTEIERRQQEIEEKKVRLYFLLHSKQFRDKIGIYEMQRLAGDVPYSDRLGMYAAFERKDQGLAAGLNFFIPSLGSWIQGDVGGALIQNGLFLAGLGLIAANENYDYDQNTFYSEENGQSDMMLYAGITIIAVEWIFGIIRPFTYVKKWNEQLASSLRISMTSLEGGYNLGPYDAYSGSSRNRGVPGLEIELLSVEY
jgi:hypothetical protein